MNDDPAVLTQVLVKQGSELIALNEYPRNDKIYIEGYYKQKFMIQIHRVLEDVILEVLISIDGVGVNSIYGPVDLQQSSGVVMLPQYKLRRVEYRKINRFFISDCMFGHIEAPTELRPAQPLPAPGSIGIAVWWRQLHSQATSAMHLNEEALIRQSRRITVAPIQQIHYRYESIGNLSALGIAATSQFTDYDELNTRERALPFSGTSHLVN